MAKKKGTAGNDVVNGTNGDSWDLLDGNDRFNGGSFADTVYGGTGNDSLYGGGGNDKLYGGDGNDLLDGGTGDDSLYGDGGSDTILAGDGNDYVSGSAGADSLSGGAGNDTIYGGGGADTIDGGEGNNRLAGGSSNQRISAGAGNDTIYGGGGNDTIDAGNGDNEIYASGGDDDDDDDHHGNGSSSGGDVITSGSGNDTIYAGSGNDSIYGGDGANRIYGGRGSDLIVTGSGNDRIYGSAGNDTIDAGGGNNELYLGSGNERVTVGDGNNLIYGGGGADTVFAGNGNNEIYLGGDGWGNSGDFVQTGNGNDTIYGGAGSDTVNAGGGNNFLRLGSGSDLVTAGSGNDTIYGGSGNDTIDAGGGNNYVRGGSGNDSINAGAGDDYIEGYEGSDRINAGDGNNFIRLGSGNDTVTAGSGNDTVYGGSSSDVISVGAGNDYVESGDGNDSIEAGRGSDTVDAGSGNDTVGNTFGAADRDRLDGGRGTDQLRLDFTRAEWMNGAVQTDIANYLRFLGTNSNANSSNGRTFEFTSTDLDVRNFEGLSVTVDGVALTAADDAVDAVNDSASTGEDNVLTGSVLGNDVAPDLIASVQLVTPPSQGGLTFNADGTYSFTPGAAFQHLAQGATATTSFTYRVTDADGDSDVATVTITVIGTNDGPVAVADSAVVNERSTVTVDVLANDTDIDDNHTFTLTGVSVAPGQGTAAIVNNTLVFAAGSDFDSLGQGETSTVTVTYTMRDEFGAVSSSTATITVQGSNAGPVVSALTGAIGEDDLSIVLTPSYSDVDTSDTHTISLLADGGVLSVSSSSVVGVQEAVLDLDQGGRVTLNPDGTFTFSTDGDFDHLAVGEQVDVSFQYRVTDNHGASSVATATVRVTGANDRPDAQNISATVSEDGPAVVLTPSYVDVDLNDTHTVLLLGSTSGASGSSGSFSPVTDLDLAGGILHANADGTISFDPAGRLDALAEGETAQVSFRYRVTDSQGVFDNALGTITVTGVNDGPVADAISAAVGEDDPSVTLTASYSDVDTSDTHTISLLGPAGDISYSSSSAAGGPENVLDLDQGGRVTLNSDGTFTFSTDGDFDYLAVGEQVDVSFQYSVTDNHGASSVATATVRVTGANDGPDAQNISATVSEDGPAVVLTPSYVDVDLNDTHTVLLLGSTSGASGSSGSFSPVTDLDLAGGILHANADGTISFDPAGRLDALAEGETAQVSFRYRVTDSHGGFDDARGTITVTGENDGPVADAISASVGEDDPSITLTASYSDVDTSDTHTISLLADGGVLSVSSSSDAGQQEAVLDLDQGGRVTLNPDGTFTFSTAGDFDHLAVGEQVDVSFQYRVTDNHGASSVATATVQVTGANDRPDAQAISATVSEDGPAVVLTPSFTDVDLNDTHTVALLEPVQSGSSQETAGSATFVPVTDLALSGGNVHVNPDGTFSFDPSNASESLAEGESRTVTFRYRVTDSSGGFDDSLATVTINGANDAPVASAVTGQVAEDAGVLTIAPVYSDVDASDTHTITVSQGAGAAAGQITLAGGGIVTVNPDGTISFDQNGAFQDLAQGDVRNVVFQYQVTDNHGAVAVQDVTITVTGSNDGPVASAITGVASEDGPAIVLQPSFTDADAGDTHIVRLLDPSASQSSQAGSSGPTSGPVTSGVLDLTLDHGVLHVNNDGSISFDPTGRNDDLAAGETRDVTFQYEVTDSHGAHSAAVGTVTVTGENDAPLATALTADVDEDSGPLVLTPSFTDVDLSDLHTITLRAEVTRVGGSSGSTHVETGSDIDLGNGAHITVNPDGTISFVQNGAYDALNNGDRAPISFEYIVTDNNGAQSVADVTIFVNGVTDQSGALVAVDDAFNPPETSTAVLTFDDSGLAGYNYNGNYYAGEVGPTYDGFVFGGVGYYQYNTVYIEAEVLLTYAGYYGYYQPSIRAVDGADFAVSSFDIGQAYYDYGSQGFPLSVHGYLDGVEVGYQLVYPEYSGYVFNNTPYTPLTHVELDPAFQQVDLVVFQLYDYMDNYVAIDNLEVGAKGSTENFAMDLAVLGNDTDSAGGAVLSVQSVQGTSALGATVTINPDGTLRYDSTAAAGADALAAGEVADDTFTYTVTDQFGNSDTATVTIHLTGVDDRAVAVDDAATLALAGGSAVSGNVLANDTDPDSPLALLNSPGEYFISYGSLLLSADGSFTYTVNPADVAFLGEGQSTTSQFSYQLVGGDTGLLTITINGVNDGPVAVTDLLNDGVHNAFTTAGTARSVSIDRLLNNDFDPDSGDSFGLWSVSGTSASGATVVWNTETNEFTYDASSVAAFQSLGEGETTTDSFTYVIRDSHGVETTGTAQVVVAGNPVAPVAVDDNFDRTSVDASAYLNFDTPYAPLNGPSPSQYGDFEFTGFYNTSYWGVNYSNTAYSWAEWNLGTGGSDGAIRRIDGGNFDLNGFSATTYVYDGGRAHLTVHGFDNGVEVATQTLLLTYAEFRANHEQNFVLSAAFDSIDEVRFEIANNEVIDGVYYSYNYLWLDNVAIGRIAAGEDAVSSLNVLANDTDASALHVSATSGTSALGATLSVNADGTVAYNPLTSAALQALDVGETLTDTFTYTVMDEYGLTDTATVTVVVGGADDAAVAVDDTASATEDGGVITGNLLANDYDPEGNAPVVLASQLAGQYGLGDGAVLTVNADGTYEYAVNGSHQDLNAGQTATDTFSYQLETGDTAILSVTVTGTNDAPVAQNDSFGSATQGPGSGGGAVPSGYIYNPENGHYYRYVGNYLTLDQHVAAAAAEGAYVVTVTSASESQFIADNLTSYALLGGTDRDQEGNWVWVGGPEAGQTFWLGYYNGYSPSGFAGWGPLNGEPNNAGDEDYVVMYNANYWNDQYNYSTPSVYEIGGMGPFTDENTVGTIDAARLLANDTDVDNGHVLHVVSVSGTSTNGATVSFDSQTGQISYDASGAAAVQALHDGEFLTDTFTYTVADEHGATSTATVSVVVGGVTENEAPTAVADTAQGTEDSVSITGNVLANDTDPDAGDVLSVSDAGVRQGTYGVLTLNADGTFSYVPDPVAQALFGGQVVTDTFAYTASDAGGLTSQASLAVQLTGVNDPAVISGTNQGEVFEDGVLVAGGDLNAADPDNAADSWQAASGTSANGIGSFTIGADGVWTYTLDNANPLVQAANTGESIADFFNVSTADGTQTTVFIAVRGQDDNLNLTGDAFDNTLTGGPGPDTLSGLDGNDVITGNGGNDQLFGGDGNDTISGNDGDDTISGGAGVDSLDGGPGTDTLILPQITPSNNVQVTTSVNLATGTFTVSNVSFGTLLNFENAIISTSSLNSVFITGTVGANYIQINGTGSGSTTGGDGNDTIESFATVGAGINAGNGDDLVISGPGNDTIVFGPGIDTFSFQNAPQGVAFISTTGLTQTNPGSGSDRINAGPPPENLIGSMFNDTLTGNSATGSSANVLDGLAGDDVLSGLAGNDTLIGNIGNDLMTGGLDADDFVFRPGDGFDAVTDFTAGSDNVVLEGFGPDIDTFAELAPFLVQSNADAVINISASQTITLLNVTASLLTQDDFIFR